MEFAATSEDKPCLASLSSFERVMFAEETKLFDRVLTSNGVAWRETGHSLAGGSEAWLTQKVHEKEGGFFRAVDNKGLDLGWVKGEAFGDGSGGGIRGHNVRSRGCTDMPCEVRSAVIQLYLDHDGQPNWEALLTGRSLTEIRDMNFSETRQLFADHAMQSRDFQSRDSYLKEVEIMVAGGIGGQVVQLQCTRSEEGVSVRFTALSGEELARLTLTANEETVGSFREAVSAALADVVKIPRIVLHDGRFLADIGHGETTRTVLNI